MSKYYVFTINNPTESDYLCVRSAVGRAQASYVCFEPEIGDASTRHLQGYIELPLRRSLNTVRKLLGDRAYLDRRRGNAQQARDYCRKEHLKDPCVAFEEYGEISVPEQGRRTDLDELKESLDAGEDILSISDAHFASYVRYRKSIDAYRRLRYCKRSWTPQVIVYWGPTGTGKTSKVYRSHESVWAYPGKGWFDGYNQEEVVLFDDFSGSEFALPYLLKLLDRYPMQVPVKGDFTNWAPRIIYITSNLNPRDWFRNAHQNHVDALFRRLTSIVHVDGINGSPF